MNTLLIWEAVPESTTLVLIPDADLDADDRKTLEMCHGKYINSDISDDDSNELNKISDALSSKKEYLSSLNPVRSKWAMRFVNYVQGDGPIVAPISHVYQCGFLM